VHAQLRVGGHQDHTAPKAIHFLAGSLVTSSILILARRAIEALTSGEAVERAELTKASTRTQPI